MNAQTKTDANCDFFRFNRLVFLGESWGNASRLITKASEYDRQDADNATHYLFPMMFCGDSIAAEVSALINDTIRSGLDGESWARY